MAALAESGSSYSSLPSGSDDDRLRKSTAAEADAAPEAASEASDSDSEGDANANGDGSESDVSEASHRYSATSSDPSTPRRSSNSSAGSQSLSRSSRSPTAPSAAARRPAPAAGGGGGGNGAAGALAQPTAGRGGRARTPRIWLGDDDDDDASGSPQSPAPSGRADRVRRWRFLPKRAPADILQALYCNPLPRHYRPPPQPKRPTAKPTRNAASPGGQSPSSRPGPKPGGLSPLRRPGPTTPQSEAADGEADGRSLTDEAGSAAPPPPPPPLSVFDVADIHVGRWRRPRSAPLPATAASRLDGVHATADLAAPARCTCRPSTAGAARPTAVPDGSRPADYVQRYAALLHEGWTPVRNEGWSRDVRRVAKGRNQGFLGARPKPQRLDEATGKALGDRLSRKWLAQRQALREEELRLRGRLPARHLSVAEEEE